MEIRTGMPAIATGSLEGLEDVELVRLFKETRRNEYMEALYNRYRPYLFRICMATLVDRNKVEDLTHTAFVNVMKKIESFDGQGPSASFRGWIATICRNACISENRREGVVLLLGSESNSEEGDPFNSVPDPEVPDPARNIERKQIADRALKVLSKLPRERAQAWFLVRIKEYSYDHAAERLGLTFDRIKSYIFYVDRKLREEFR